MAEGGDSVSSVASSSAAAMEDQAISASTLLEKLRCSQPAVIARKRRVTINPPPYGQKGVATSIRSPAQRVREFLDEHLSVSAIRML